jgi:hypothetical protein
MTSLPPPRRAARPRDEDTIIERHPAFQLEDELLVEGEEMSCGATSTLVRAATGTRNVRRERRRHFVGTSQVLGLHLTLALHEPQHHLFIYEHGTYVMH